MYLPDMSMIGPMSTPDYQATPDVWDWDAMPDPTMTDDGLDVPVTEDMPVFGDLY